MKCLLIIVLSCAGYLQALAQDSLLLADNGKYAYAEIAGISLPEARLHEALNACMKSVGMKNIVTLAGGLGCSATGYFLLRRRSIAGSTPDAQVAYTIRVEFKDYKYRCLISGFMLSPVLRDRFGVHRAAEGLEAPLERKPGKLNERLWQQHKAELLDQCKALAAQIRQALSAPAEPVRKTKTVSLSSDW